MSGEEERHSTPAPSDAHNDLVQAQEALLAHKRYSAESEIVHVTPIDDLTDHAEVTCWCGPRIETLRRIDGGTRYLITHHSLDGREFAATQDPS